MGTVGLLVMSTDDVGRYRLGSYRHEGGLHG